MNVDCHKGELTNLHSSSTSKDTNNCEKIRVVNLSELQPSTSSAQLNLPKISDIKMEACSSSNSEIEKNNIEEVREKTNVTEENVEKSNNRQETLKKAQLMSFLLSDEDETFNYGIDGRADDKLAEIVDEFIYEQGEVTSSSNKLEDNVLCKDKKVTFTSAMCVGSMDESMPSTSCDDGKKSKKKKLFDDHQEPSTSADKSNKRKSDLVPDSSPEKKNKLEEAPKYVGPIQLNITQLRYKLSLVEIFPDADPQYLNERCARLNNELDVNEVITDMLQNPYPVRQAEQNAGTSDSADEPQPGPSSPLSLEEKVEAQYETLLAILPNADPEYLREQCEAIAGNEDDMKTFVSAILENKQYPTREEYEKRQKMLELQKKFTEQFSIEGFLEIFPTPVKYFRCEKNNSKNSRDYAFQYLKGRYRKVAAQDILRVLRQYDYSLTKTCEHLDGYKGVLRRTTRPAGDCRLPQEVNIPFLQEDISSVRSVLENLQKLRLVLQTVLNPAIFSKMLQRKQLEEVKAAGIEDLETCPFCDFASIPPREDKVFRCLNPDCMRESCRNCKQPNHIPLRCEEVEQPDEVKARTYIEDRMTEALVRTCYKCQKKFIKEDGCNKMTCTCGAIMCYICRKPVKDYSHFNGQGGDAFHKCPLYSSNDVIHVNPVKEEAKKAKEEVEALNPNLTLKNDPTKNLPVARGGDFVHPGHQRQQMI
ncbi:hypothetical protein L9F63_016965, partial [Diploptera punctata]